MKTGRNPAFACGSGRHVLMSFKVHLMPGGLGLRLGILERSGVARRDQVEQLCTAVNSHPVSRSYPFA